MERIPELAGYYEPLEKPCQKKMCSNNPGSTFSFERPPGPPETSAIIALQKRTYILTVGLAVLLAIIALMAAAMCFILYVHHFTVLQNQFNSAHYIAGQNAEDIIALYDHIKRLDSSLENHISSTQRLTAETRRNVDTLENSLENLNNKFEQLKATLSGDLSRVNSSLQQDIQFLSENLTATVMPDSQHLTICSYYYLFMCLIMQLPLSLIIMQAFARTCNANC